MFFLSPGSRCIRKDYPTTGVLKRGDMIVEGQHPIASQIRKDYPTTGVLKRVRETNSTDNSLGVIRKDYPTTGVLKLTSPYTNH